MAEYEKFDIDKGSDIAIQLELVDVNNNKKYFINVIDDDIITRTKLMDFLKSQNENNIKLKLKEEEYIVRLNACDNKAKNIDGRMYAKLKTEEGMTFGFSKHVK